MTKKYRRKSHQVFSLKYNSGFINLKHPLYGDQLEFHWQQAEVSPCYTVSFSEFSFIKSCYTFLLNCGSIRVHKQSCSPLPCGWRLQNADCTRGLLPVKTLKRMNTFPPVFVVLAILRKERSTNIAVNLSGTVGMFPVSHEAHCTSGKCH